MSTITVKDGTTIFYKDWGTGPVVTFSHGWPLCSDAWDAQMLFLAQNGFRVVRVAAAVLIGAVPPVIAKSAANPDGIPIEVFDGLRSGVAKDRSQFWKDFAIMFYGANRPGAKVSQGMLDQFWLWSMQGGLKNVYDSIKAFSETDFHEDLKKFDVPTLVMHGEDDQIVPIDISGRRSAKLIKGAKELFYPAMPHGLTATNADQVNADLLKFLKSVQQVRRATA